MIPSCIAFPSCIAAELIHYRRELHQRDTALTTNVPERHSSDRARNIREAEIRIQGQMAELERDCRVKN